MDKQLNVISFNCTGLKYRNYDYLKDLFIKSEIMLLQKTWLHAFQHDDIKGVL